MKKLMLLVLIFAFALTGLMGCKKKEDIFYIGVNQLVKHPALDASYKGFVDALADAGYVDGEKIKIDYQNAQGDPSNAVTIASKLVNDDSDLILAIATKASLAVANATKDIPVLFTAVTDPVGEGLVQSNEVPGGNITGSSDLTPVKEQIELLVKLLPEAKDIAILYSSSESNSEFQANLAEAEALTYGLTARHVTVSNINEIQQVVESIVGKVDAIYVPTDNTIADAMVTVAMIANSNGLPIICGEAGMVDNGGLATYGMDYYQLGRLTGMQAIEIIEGKNKPQTMPVAYIPVESCEFKINEDVAKQLGITIPADLQ